MPLHVGIVLCLVVAQITVDVWQVFMSQSIMPVEITSSFAHKVTLAARQLFRINMFQCMPVKVAFEQSLEITANFSAKEVVQNLAAMVGLRMLQQTTP